ncbi:Rdx family protein [Candidatus Bathyarchaeota archaeon]|nr:Rdx family protein [Candidatus Bathyarchaeota archaeon]
MDATAQQAVFPRVTIEYCTRCKWMLRAAYVRPPPPRVRKHRSNTQQYAQELLSTFEATLGEVSLRPAPSGTFRIQITTDPSPPALPAAARSHLLNREPLRPRRRLIAPALPALGPLLEFKPPPLFGAAHR